MLVRTRNGHAKGHASNVHTSKCVACLLPGLHDRTTGRSCKGKRDNNATEAAASHLTSVFSLSLSSLMTSSGDSWISSSMLQLRPRLGRSMLILLPSIRMTLLSTKYTHDAIAARCIPLSDRCFCSWCLRPRKMPLILLRG
eukprot:12029066-Heterocapsa_arctica.AAC.1